MKPRRRVDAEALLQAHLLVTARGMRRSLRALERAEPTLAGYLMEGTSAIHARLLAGCDSPAAARRVQRRILALALTCVEAVQQSARRRDRSLGRRRPTTP